MTVSGLKVARGGSNKSAVGMFLMYKLAVWLLPASWKGRRGLDNGAI
jgi:hypothetical protein